MKPNAASLALVLLASVCVPLALLAPLTPAPAWAAKKPKQLVTDDRVKQVAYDPNQVYELVGTYGYQTSIEFADDETVKVVTVGDSIAWQTVPYQNRLFIKAVEPNAATNLTVITDKRTYYFKLMSAKSRASQTFLVRFIYPNTNTGLAGGVDGMGGAGRSNHGFDPAKLNLDYGTSGNKSAIRLTRAFDDGQFTYFLFDANAEIPTVYTVGPDGTESIVNTRREGAYLVVERTASLFTLRNGDAYLCVQNNANPYQRTVSGPVSDPTHPGGGN
ncbi:P-type conjugative transfer protein VirB9 (plasmid) [Pandoraea faecigallinarum]|uniref:P-type conjugative transfer protein VirB9 n=1 Tax=Pandoraea faecigallinarum TaxID=656179 RepID=A0A0H3WYG6_9BURK|nr:P-type conjugative transfer protein VirB9 [Pandoraea faecigallinarum]AKM33204.1 P-type conjugative transfer protein VirB9 [Pandoraea faecigallinarum]